MERYTVYEKGDVKITYERGSGNEKYFLMIYRKNKPDSKLYSRVFLPLTTTDPEGEIRSLVEKRKTLRLGEVEIQLKYATPFEFRWRGMLDGLEADVRYSRDSVEIILEKPGVHVVVTGHPKHVKKNWVCIASFVNGINRMKAGIFLEDEKSILFSMENGAGWSLRLDDAKCIYY